MQHDHQDLLEQIALLEHSLWKEADQRMQAEQYVVQIEEQLEKAENEIARLKKSSAACSGTIGPVDRFCTNRQCSWCNQRRFSQN